jgi:antitoxin component of MazEF toxin-antitoxin module
MALTKTLTKTGNSDTLVITKEMQQYIGIKEDKQVEIHYQEDGILIKAPRRQSFAEAAAATYEQYDEALRNLAK